MAHTASPSSSKRSLELVTPGLQEGVTDGQVQSMVDQLTTLDARGHWVVSCYLKLEPRDRARGKYLIKLKNRIRNRLDWLVSQSIVRAERDAIARDLERIRERLDAPTGLPAGRGIALFACEPLDLLVAIPLPQVYRSRLVVDRTPLVRELAAVSEEFGLVYCALYDRTSARFFRVTALGVEELTALAPGDVSRTTKYHGNGASSRWAATHGEYGHHQRIREEKHRHYASIAQRLFDLSRGGALRGFVLAGIGAEAEAVVPYLHPYAQEHLLGTARLHPKTATPAEVQSVVLDARRKADQEEEYRLVRELKEKRGTGWAVNGIASSLRVLSRGQVRTLLVNPTAAVPGFRCAASDRLSVDGDGCEGSPIPVEDVIDDALEEALRQRSHVDVIETPELRDRIDGLAALLRFKQR